MSWRKVKLGSLLVESKIESAIPDAERRITVRLKVKGVKKRPYEAGVEGGTKYYVRRAGQFIYGKQNLFKGAFGIVPPELDGFESSQDIPAFDMSRECLPEWLIYYLKQNDFYKSLEGIATGTGSRRIQPAKLYEVEIPLPKIAEQKEIIDRLHKTEGNFQKLFDEIKKQQSHLQLLRQTILQEALQGKLTQQNPADEPASELLKRIKAEKQKLAKEGKLKKEKELPLVTGEEMPFALPRGWIWCRLEELCNYIVDCPHSTPKFQEGGEYCIDTTSMEQGQILFDKLRKVSKQTFDGRNRRLIPQTNDIVFSREGTVGMAVLLPEQFHVCLGQRVMLFRTSSFVEPKYFRHIIVSPFFVQQWQADLKGAASKHINIRDLKAYLVPLPPLPAQQDIIDAIEKLNILSDKLHSLVDANQTQAKQLLQTVLTEAFHFVGNTYAIAKPMV